MQIGFALKIKIFYGKTNMKNTVIFGNRDIAELAHYYLTIDSSHQPIAFCVESAVVPFEEVEKIYPPDDFNFYAPIYASEMNRLKDRMTTAIKEKGYEFISYISSKAHVWNAEIGENAFVLEGSNIQPFCKVGKNLVMWSSSHIGHHSKVGNNVFISGNVVVAGHNEIGDFCFLGTNSTTKENISVAPYTFIGQHSSIVKSIKEEGGLWWGCPVQYIKSSFDVKL
jgi:UDP-3-O-[3-hydroxymyristoyl] glucosamine N-acyltransferase